MGTEQVTNLYADLLQGTFDQLPTTLQQAFAGADRTASGTLYFRSAQGWWRRGLARLYLLPVLSGPIASQIAITGDGQSETWRRIFGNRVFVTTQKVIGEVLSESNRIGRIEFRVSSDGAQLFFESQLSYFFGCPLPRWARLMGSAKAHAIPGGWYTMVKLWHPIAGLLLSYEGSMIFRE